MRGDSYNATHYVPTCSSTQYLNTDQTAPCSGVPMTDYVYDIFCNNQSSQPSDMTKEQPQAKMLATAYDAQDVYKKLRIIYFIDDMDLIQVASITVTRDGIRFVNTATGSAVVPDLLPSSIFFSRDVFQSYDITFSENKSEIELLINFTTLMDFLENNLSNALEDDVYPLHIALDKWLYISMQQTPSIQDLDFEVSTSSLPPASRFCFVPSELLSAIGDQAQTVPDDNVDTHMTEDQGMINNAILMLHPLNYKHVDKSAFSTPLFLPPQSNVNNSVVPSLPTTSSMTLTDTIMIDDDILNLVNVDGINSINNNSHNSHNIHNSHNSHNYNKESSDAPPKKRLKTSTEQVELLEEWFKRNPLPTKQLKEQLSQQLDGVSLRQVEVWFQNRRAKQKKAEAKVPSAAPSSMNPPSPSSPMTVPTAASSPSPVSKKNRKKKFSDPASPNGADPSSPVDEFPSSPMSSEASGVAVVPSSAIFSKLNTISKNKKFKTSSLSSMISHASLLPEISPLAGGGSQ